MWYCISNAKLILMINPHINPKSTLTLTYMYNWYIGVVIRARPIYWLTDYFGHYWHFENDRISVKFCRLLRIIFFSENLSHIVLYYLLIPNCSGYSYIISQAQDNSREILKLNLLTSKCVIGATIFLLCSSRAW